MTRIGRMFADFSPKPYIIRADPLNPRHPRSIPAISVLIRSIRVIRVLFLFTNNFYMRPSSESALRILTIYVIIDKIQEVDLWRD